jgi:hypothetical protein
MKLKILTAAAVALAATGCASYRVADTGEVVPQVALAPIEAWPAELTGHTLEVYTESGSLNAVNLAPDGKLGRKEALRAARLGRARGRRTRGCR